MAATTSKLTENGFVSSKQSGSLAFQSATNWSKQKATGIMVIGTYDGLTEVNDFGKQDIKVIAAEDGIYYAKVSKDSDKIERREFKAGDTVIVNASGNLGSSIQRMGVELGDTVAIEYEGMLKSKKGKLAGKSVHQFTVYRKAATATA